ncbi:hypothetical protein KUTeg_023133 [Tegillarca granosa]|uniref:PiggyBac transposable element-derived protein 4 C-terminal zinc-finger domain-containing protein n=1 Tax=Tegillarca granosa TaxID=220873 RepID=A0ABQ9E0T8_TEGGR|nr:hypothetical protein KUTeg_023133 [Tegillarca granosa]
MGPSWSLMKPADFFSSRFDLDLYDSLRNRFLTAVDIDNSTHTVVPISGDKAKKKLCWYCQFYQIKTKSGWRPNTIYKCDICDKAFCTKPDRNCFQIYHKMLLEGSVPQPPSANINWTS